MGFKIVRIGVLDPQISFFLSILSYTRPAFAKFLLSFFLLSCLGTYRSGRIFYAEFKTNILGLKSTCS